MADNVNASRYRMATGYGLFGEDRESLPGVDYACPCVPRDTAPGKNDVTWLFGASSA